MTQTESPLARVDVAGVPLLAMSLDEAAEWLCKRSVSDEDAGLGVHLVNANCIAASGRDPDYHALLHHSEANLPDGKPVAVIGHLRDARVRQVRGPALFEAVMARGRRYGLRHFLLGSTPSTVGRLREALSSRYPGVQIVGAASPPFRQSTDAELAEQDEVIKGSDAHVVWVGLGTPKQDFEAERVATSTGCVAVAVGAAFEFSAGTKPEAPRWMSQSGLEWSFRLATEPRRLWRRYLIGNAQFLRLAWVRRGDG